MTGSDDGHHVPRQRWFGGGLARTAFIAIGGLAFFALAILVVARSSTPAPGPGSSSASDESTSSAECWKLDFFVDDSTLVNPEKLDEIAESVPDDRSGRCLAAGEMVMVVQGLPGVSGIYKTRDGNVAVEGWSLGDGASELPIGRCFVDDVDIFKTKAVASRDLEKGGEIITIDVGLSGGGPYAAVVREIGGFTDSEIPLFEVSHNYNPGSGFVGMTGVVWEADNFTGRATFKPTGPAETYNDRLFSPWTDTQYLGQPNHDFTIDLFCG